MNSRNIVRLNSSVSFYLAVKKLLEDLFGADWFVENSKRKINHPAFRKWLFCGEMVKKGGVISVPVDREECEPLASLLLDNFILTQSSGGEFSAFSFGGVKKYGDDKVRKRIQAIITDPKQYNSLMTELSLSAYCSLQDLAVTPFEEIGYPDFRLDIDGMSLPIMVECKNIEKGTNCNRFECIVKKANKQIKNVGVDCYGVLFVDVTAMIERNSVLSDSVPDSVEIILEKFSKLLGRFNSSVSSAILFWDEFSILGEEQGSDRIMAFIRRRSCNVTHKNPKHRLPSNTSLLEFGNTFCFIAERMQSEKLQKMPFVSSINSNMVSRVSMCPCGSGKRVKNCCGSLF